MLIWLWVANSTLWMGPHWSRNFVWMCLCDLPMYYCSPVTVNISSHKNMTHRHSHDTIVDRYSSSSRAKLHFLEKKFDVHFPCKIYLWAEEWKLRSHCIYKKIKLEKCWILRKDKGKNNHEYDQLWSPRYPCIPSNRLFQDFMQTCHVLVLAFRCQILS
jgi:hypothetical protein